MFYIPVLFYVYICFSTPENLVLYDISIIINLLYLTSQDRPIDHKEKGNQT